MRVWAARSAIALATAASLAACGTPPEAGPPPTPSPSSSQRPAAGLASVLLQVPDRFAQAPLDEPRHALIPAGWTIEVIARVPKARMAAFAPDGALLISVPATGQVLTVRPDQRTLLDGLEQPHGLFFAGPTLYVAESNQIDAYDYVDGQALNRRTVAGGLPDAKSPDLHGAYAHALKSVVVGSDGAVYFSIGSTGNISAEDRDATPPRATIMRVPPGGGPAAPFATGVRNGTGLALAPDGSLWTAVNNRDNVADPQGRVRQAYVDDHPPESVAKLTPGRELGWPYCNPDGPPPAGFIRDMQTNADGAQMDCAALAPVEQTLGAHSAPLGMSFAELPGYGPGALVGVHGSWNRRSPQAPEVSFFGWEDGTLGPQQTLAGGFQADDGSRWGRPVAAVTGPDGAVYITDDYAGAVYRLAP
ncbi:MULTISPECIES: PQQ-dependent sugar dehydrogenase [Mycobacterium]|uniref:Gluconolaconase n=1 Tax=Mycobacterium syngnathidarum TaxID=1908205 RepID=A0A1S1JX82_9MYCO|nr:MULTISPECIES: gluconolaconase [Mycobacterium]MCG7606825.1 gluconolaconase [Mycobacterium sp. CnD-18-1]OHT92552.1 gluconolaconase [Mycobacterium syngnathidarum]OLT98212.1 gluconolaconase [Mycobacterium syngnathidarum]